MHSGHRSLFVDPSSLRGTHCLSRTMAPPQAKKRVLLIGALVRSGTVRGTGNPVAPHAEVANSPATSAHVSWRSSSTWPWWTARTHMGWLLVHVGPIELPTNNSKDAGTPPGVCQEMRCTTKFNRQKVVLKHFTFWVPYSSGKQRGGQR